MICTTCSNTGRILHNGVILAEDALDYRDCPDCDSGAWRRVAHAWCVAAVETLPASVRRGVRVEGGAITLRTGLRGFGADIEPTRDGHGWTMTVTHGVPDAARVAEVMAALPASPCGVRRAS